MKNKGNPLLPPVIVGRKYAAKVARFHAAMNRETRREILAVMHDNVGIINRIKVVIFRVRSKYENIFNETFSGIVGKMIRDVDNSSRAGTQTSIRQLTPNDITVNGIPIDADLLEALTTQNVSLFKTITSEHFATVEKAVIDSIIKGGGIKELTEFFQEYSNGHKNYAKNRALDQTRKAFTSMNVSRLKKTGIQKVEWLHSHGSNAPRKLHKQLDGQIFDINDPPFIGVMYGQDVHGFGGVLPYCRCTIRPVIEINK